jgi:hypothetical protein
MKTHVAYDKRSGNIISIHHGNENATHARQRAHHLSRLEEQHIEVITVATESVGKNKSYKVDISRKVLVEASAEEHGVAFSFGSTSGS